MSPANVPAPRGLTQFVSRIMTSLGHQTGIWRVRSASRPLAGDSAHLVGSVPGLVWRLAECIYEGHESEGLTYHVLIRLSFDPLHHEPQQFAPHQFRATQQHLPHFTLEQQVRPTHALHHLQRELLPPSTGIAARVPHNAWLAIPQHIFLQRHKYSAVWDGISTGLSLGV
jgi:hypothetical protein